MRSVTIAALAVAAFLAGCTASVRVAKADYVLSDKYRVVKADCGFRPFKWYAPECGRI